MGLNIEFRLSNAYWVPETPLSLIQYFKDQHILKGLGNKQKNHLKHLVGPTLGVEFPLVTGCLTWFLSRGLSSSQGWLADFLGSCPGFVEAGEADGVYFIRYASAFWHCGELSSTHKNAPVHNLSLETLRKIIITIFELCSSKPFVRGQRPYSII